MDMQQALDFDFTNLCTKGVLIMAALVFSNLCNDE